MSFTFSVVARTLSSSSIIMPLSSVGISSVQQEEYYIVFGALSLKSSLEDILLEITSLVDNALDLAEITEEYSL